MTPKNKYGAEADGKLFGNRPLSNINITEVGTIAKKARIPKLHQLKRMHCCRLIAEDVRGSSDQHSPLRLEFN
jgi:hypothetical protein